MLIITLYAEQKKKKKTQIYPRERGWRAPPFSLQSGGKNQGVSVLHHKLEDLAKLLPTLRGKNYPAVRSTLHFLVAEMVKNLPATAGGRREAGSIPGSGRSLEEEMATHPSILAWIIPWTEEPGGLQSLGSQRVGHDWVTDTQVAAAPTG